MNTNETQSPGSLHPVVRHFDEYPEAVRPRLRDIRTRNGRVLAICEYECRQCGLKMDDTQSDVNDAHTRACCPRCGSEDLRDSDYVPNDQAHPTAARATVDGTENL